MFLILGAFIWWLSYSSNNKILYAVPVTPYPNSQSTLSIYDVTGCGRPVDLNCELARLFQAGGKIVLTKGINNQILAYRAHTPPANRSEEMENRIENWRIFRLLNIAREDSLESSEPTNPSDPANSANSIDFEISDDQVTLLERFALTDYGAVFIREVVTDMLVHFNKGYFEMSSSIDLYNIDLKFVKLSQLLTGKLSEEGEWDITYLFTVNSCAGYGAKAQPGFITLGYKGFRKTFPLSQELVDPLAIIAHEFGHTKYGDPKSGGHEAGEAATVRNYENFVRILNRYPPRREYCSVSKSECMNVVSLKTRPAKI